MGIDRLHQVADLLLAIEAEMRRLELWECEPPPDEALLSLVPFCHDTLEFHQWLQWKLLPQMKALLEADASLPAESDIHPLAEYSFNRLEQDTDQLLGLLERFDRLLGRS